MIKYKLIKEYPGSPKIGTVVEKESKIKSNTSYYYREGEKRWCIFDNHVENNPEYWEEVNEAYLVLLRDGYFLNSFQVYKSNTIEPSSHRLYFKTKESAVDFVIHNKPCLNYEEVVGIYIKTLNVDKTELNALQNALKQLIETKL